MDKQNKNVFKKRNPHKSRRSGAKRKRNRIENPLKSEEQFQIRCSFDASNTSAVNNSLDRNSLSNWSFPERIHKYYANKGIDRLFDWQVECLELDGVLDGRNLVYSAPTSAGKSMVADILLYKKLLEHKKKAIIILPFISVTQEKMLSLKQVLRSVGVSVDAFAGGVNPRGGLARVDVAVCTIEKANNMINKLIEDNKLSEIGLIVVDELHMIGNSSRGFLLELLLTKVLYMKSRISHNIQIIGMSATIPNLDVIARWLDATLYVTHFRPVPLHERVSIGDVIYDSPQMTEYRRLDLKDYDIKRSEATDDSSLIYLAIETMTNDLGALVFCSTKAQCENLSQTLAVNIWAFGCGKKVRNEKTEDFQKKIRETLVSNKISEVLQQLERCPAGLDPCIKSKVMFGVAYHHAGLSMDERSIIEQAFRDGTIKILCATSTLSAGVNLPARLVIIRSPLDFRSSLMDVLTYRQMIGRAGRQGVDTMGESILMCSESLKPKALELIGSELSPITSCLMYLDSIDGQSGTSSLSSGQSFNGLKRAILEIIANGTANSYKEVSEYISNTFLASMSGEVVSKSIIDDIIGYLVEEKLIHSMTDTESQQQKITPTQFGKAVLASGISPKDGAFILSELNKAKANLCLCNDLHLLYEVTPINLSEQLESIDWQHFLDIWDKLDADMRKVGKLVGVSENTLMTLLRKTPLNEYKLLVHKRFYAALALQDLANEESLQKVSKKFKCSKGVLQSLQQNASSFAGMLTTFCNRLGWHNLEILIEQFQSRLFFGVQRELIDLMRLTSLNSSIARLLFDSKYETVVSLANVEKCSSIELILMNSGPFDKEREVEGAVIWLPVLNKAMSVREIAKAIVFEAKELINKDLGIKVYDLSQASSADSNDYPNEELDLLSQESNEVPTSGQCFTKIKPISGHEMKENCNEIEANVEDMSLIEESAIVCGTDGNRSHIPSPMSTSDSGQPEPLDRKSDPKAVMSSTPIANTSRSSILRLKAENLKEIVLSSDRKVKDSSMSFSFGDSLDDISWDRLNLDLNRLTENPEECQEKADISMKNLSTISGDLLTNRVESPDLFRDCDTLSTNSEHSSKRSSSPSPSGKFGHRVNKRPFSTTSSVSLLHSDDSILQNSEDSSDSLKLIDSNDSDTSSSSVFLKPLFKGPKVGDKFNVVSIESNNLPLIDNLMNKLIHKKTFCLHFKTEAKNSIKIIGSKIKTLKNTTQEFNGLDLNYNNTVVTALTICFEGENTVYYVSTDSALKRFSDQMNGKLSSDLKIITFDLNLCYKALKQCFGVDVQTLNTIDWFDVRIAQWVLDPESRRPADVKDLVKDYLKHFLYLFNSKTTSVEMVCISTALMFPLINQLMSELEAKKQIKAYKRTEIPSRFTVANIELNGIAVDFEYMNAQLTLLNETKRQLEAKGYEIANMRFKFSNPTQIASVLYEKLNLLSNYYSVHKNVSKPHTKGKPDRKAPKHLSTSKVALKRLISLSSNPLPRIILDWRRVDNAIKKSIKSVLNNLIFDKKSNIHVIHGLCDDWSSTGRISMHEPNLIAIAKDFSIDGIDLEENNCNQTVCFSLRKCFIARKGYVLVSADYSQLELRILAHLSRDKRLTEVLNSGGDVFKSIASVWRSKPIEEINDEERQQSKQICYGMIYGKGAKSLAEDLEVNEEDAKEFMDSFINRYEGVKKYIFDTVEECRDRGFVETISGRRRYLPHIHSSNSMLRSKAERQAINSTIQGSAADLIKTAMTALQSTLLGIDSRIVLQMFDELMFEVIETSVQTFVQTLTQCMEHCLKNFSVDLPVRAKVGPNWAQLKPIEPIV